MSSQPNINDKFFDSTYKHAWKKTIPPALTLAEVDFIIDVAGLSPGAHVLDLMCGYGRHALELGKRGIKVTAVDNLQDYVSEVNAKAAEENLPVKAICSNALDFEFNDMYDAVICMGNSFAFFNQDDSVSLLKKIEAHLQNRGFFIVNSWMVAEIILKHFQGQTWHYAGDYKCVLEYRYLINPSRIESKQTIISPDGTIEMLNGIDYVFTFDQLESMFAQAGLTTIKIYSTPRKKEFVLGDLSSYIVIGRAPKL